MASPDGKPVYFKNVPWKKEAPKVSCDCERCTCTSSDPVYVDASGDYVNSEGDPLNERDWDLHPDGA